MHEKDNRCWYMEAQQQPETVEAAKRALFCCLNDEQKRLFDRYCAIADDYRFCVVQDAFCEGIRIGGKLMAEMWKAE